VPTISLGGTGEKGRLCFLERREESFRERREELSLETGMGRRKKIVSLSINRRKGGKKKKQKRGETADAKRYSQMNA